METNQIIEKLQELGKDPEFLEQAKSIKDKGEIVAMLHRFGWDVTEQELVEEIGPEVRKLLNIKEGAELNAEDLETVSGGIYGIDDVLFWGAMALYAWIYGAILANSKKSKKN